MPTAIEFGDERLPWAVWNAIHPEPNTGCWLWTGEVTPAGYGRIRMKSRARRVAHAAVHETFHGPIAEGLEFDHLCQQTCCVNPYHVEPVTHDENMRRRRKPHCKYGHLKDPAYLHDCRECCKIRAAAQRSRNKVLTAA